MTNNVRDFVLPVCNLGHDSDGIPVKKNSALKGTCFLIGDRGYALTAAHVLEQVENDIARVLVPVPNSGGTWDACLIREGEVHPTDDIGILKIELPRPIKSPVLFAADEPPPSFEYTMWGYPEAIAEEVKYHNLPAGSLDFNPIPVFFRGYIRRKLGYSPNPSLEMYRGKSFYEVSEFAGSCCSGSPLSLLSNPPGVFAIYMADEATGRRCGYAMNLLRLLDWVPEILGTPIRDEVSHAAAHG